MATLERTPEGQLEAVVLAAGELRGDLRARRRHDRLLAAPPRRGAARPARRARRVARDGQVVRPPAAAPVGQPAARLALRGGRAGGGDRPRARGSSAPTSTTCRSTARSPPPRTGTWSTRGRGRRLGAARRDARVRAPRRPARRVPVPARARRWSCELAGEALTVTTTVEATGEDDVPLAFGWHPWLSLPGVPRAEWELSLPAREGLAARRARPADRRADRARRDAAPLGDRVLDNHCKVAEDARFAIAGGGREIAVEWAGGYTLRAGLRAAALDVVCLEPMMAPVAALSTGKDLRAGRALAATSGCASPERASGDVYRDGPPESA